MKKLIKITSISLILILAGSFGVMVHHFATSSTFRMVAVYMDPDYGPSPFTWGAEKAFYFFHPGEADIEQLNSEAGAQYVVDVFEKHKARSVLEHLLDHGLKINSVENVTGEGLTALHAAALSNNSSGVELLLEFGADPHLKDDKDRTALDLAQASDEARPDQDYSPVIKRLEKAMSASGGVQESS